MNIISIYIYNYIYLVFGNNIVVKSGLKVEKVKIIIF